MSASSPQPEPAAPAPKPRRRGFARRWGRRFGCALLLLALLLVALRIAIPPLAPTVAARVGPMLGLSVELGDLSLSVHRGRAAVGGLVVRPLAKEGEPPADPILRLDHAAVDLDLRALLHARLRVQRAEVDGLELVVLRRPDGRFQVEELLPKPAPEAAPEPKEPPEPGPLDLGLPVEIAALRAQGVSLVYRDESLAEPFELHLRAGLRADALGAPDGTGTVDGWVAGSPLLDLARIRASLASGGPHLTATVGAEVHGFHPRALGPLLESLGLRARADALSGAVQLDLGVEPLDAAGEELRVEAALTRAGLSADGVEGVALDEARAVVSPLSATGATIAEVRLRGGRVSAARGKDGLFRWLGIELADPDALSAGLAGPPPPAGAPPAPPPPKPAPPAADAAPGFRLSGLEHLELADFAAELADELQGGPEPIALHLDRLRLDGLSLDPSASPPPAGLSLAARAPGLVGGARLEGSLQAVGPKLGADFAVDVEGIRLERARPYLAALGIESSFRDGRFACRLKADWTPADDGGGEGGASLTGLRLADGAELAAVDRFGAEGVQWQPDRGLRVGSVTAEGTRLSVRREAGGAIDALGLRLGGVAPAAAPAPSGAPAEAPTTERAKPEEAPAAPAPAGPAPAPAAVSAPLRFELGELHWGDVDLHLVDGSLEHPVDLQVNDLALDLGDLVVGGAPGGPRPAPAHLRFRTSAEGVAEEFAVEGTLQGGGGVQLDAELALTGRGITLAALAPFLADQGIELRLRGAEARAKLSASARLEDGAFRLDASIANATWSDGGEELAGIDELALREFVASSEGIALGELALRKPRLRAARDGAGALEALGVRLAPKPVEEGAQPAPAAAPAAPASNPLEAILNEPLALPSVKLGRLAVEDASIHWSDATLAPPVDAELQAHGELSELALGSSDAARFEWGIASPGTLGSLAIEGELVPDPARLGVKGRVEMNGLSDGPLARYLPPGTRIATQDGRLALAFDASWSAVEAGGRAARVEIQDLSYRDGEAGEPVLALDRFALAASRLDARAKTFDVDEIALAGFTIETRRTKGGFRALGLELGSAPPSAEPAPAEEGAPAAPSAPAAPATSGLSAFRFDESALPNARLGALDLELAHLRYLDETSADAVPLDLTLHLTTPGPQVLIGPEPTKLPPFELHLSGSAAPLASDVTGSLSLEPYFDQPELAAEWKVAGIRGASLVKIAPQFAGVVDGSSMEEGEFGGKLAGSLRWRRRSPVDFDLATGFGADLRFSEIALRTGAEREEVAGIDGISIQVQRVQPASGDVYVRSVEIDRPHAKVLKDAQGIHAFGLTLLPPPPPATEAHPEAVEAPSKDVAPTEEEVAALPPAEPPPAQPEGTTAVTGPEFRVDRLRVSGLDFEYRDTSVDPPVEFPLTDLDLVVDGFTTRAFREERAVGFRADLVGGVVEMPEHTASGSLIGGILGVATSVLPGNGKTVLEERPVFDEISAAGRFAFYPNPHGWLRLRVRDLELLPLRGAAAAAGIEIKDGLMSTRVDARMEEQKLGVDTRTTFQSLSLSEPIGGPISSVLKLPAPLDTVLWVLQNERGEQIVPVAFELDASQGLTSGQIVNAATSALAKVISSALTGSPKRVLSSVTDLPLLSQINAFLGKIPGLKWIFGEDEAAAFAGRRFEVLFEPGVTAPPRFQLERLKPLVEALRENDDLGAVLTHELGGGDVTRAAVLANPTPEQCQGLAVRLRQRKAELLALRAEVAGELEALYAANRTAEAEAPSAELRQLDRDLGETESALDEVFELLAPGSDRRADRRTRDAAIRIGTERLEALKRELVRLAGEGVAARIELRSARFSKPEGEGGGKIRATAVLLR